MRLDLPRYVAIFNTPAGKFSITHDDYFIHRAGFTETDEHTSPSSHPIVELVSQQLDAYFHDSHHRFQLPLKPHGTLYQQRVWNALLVIPVGRTLTYGELAITLQSAPRAVGQACKKNPLGLFIPCHRVVGKDNQGGYMGQPAALKYKLALLEHESTARQRAE